LHFKRPIGFENSRETPSFIIPLYEFLETWIEILTLAPCYELEDSPNGMEEYTEYLDNLLNISPFSYTFVESSFALAHDPNIISFTKYEEKREGFQ
jgi:hypothetical protein